MNDPAGQGTESPWQRLLLQAAPAAPYELPGLISDCARALGASNSIVYVADLQQEVLVPVAQMTGTPDDTTRTVLNVDSTLAGRAFQSLEMQVQNTDETATRVWLPLSANADRIGVLEVTFADELDPTRDDHAWNISEMRMLAVVAGVLVAAKSVYGDTFVRLRRRVDIGLASEVQWSLLPPLNYVGTHVTVAAALEPAYQVAGDTIDYSIDEGKASIGIFDLMGHGLVSAQCAVLVVAAYRNSRRSALGLPAIVQHIEDALATVGGSNVFSTAVIAELDTASGVFTWINAGHPEPLLLRGGKLIKSLQMERTPPLGLGYVSADYPVSVGLEALEPGDQILFYTDGVVEARSPDGEFFGTDRLVELVIRHLAGGLAAPETMRRVVRELVQHHQGPLRDDATILLLEWRPSKIEVGQPS